jgi:hypothetical protein
MDEAESWETDHPAALCISRAEAVKAIAEAEAFLLNLGKTAQ